VHAGALGKLVLACMLKVIEWHPDDPDDAAPAVSSVNGEHSGDNDDDNRHSSDDLEADDMQGRVSHVYLPSRCSTFFVTSLVLFIYLLNRGELSLAHCRSSAHFPPA
jgi:hypothetical protein